MSPALMSFLTNGWLSETSVAGRRSRWFRSREDVRGGVVRVVSFAWCHSRWCRSREDVRGGRFRSVVRVACELLRRDLSKPITSRRQVVAIQRVLV